MSTLEGDIAEVISSQGIELHNVTDNKNYRQLFNLQFGTNRKMTQKTKSDATIDYVEGISQIIIEGDILVTTPQIAELLLLTTLTTRQIPVKSWRLKTTDRSKTNATLTINGKVQTCTMTRQMLGHAWFHIAILGLADSVTVA